MSASQMISLMRAPERVGPYPEPVVERLIQEMLDSKELFEMLQHLLRDGYTHNTLWDAAVRVVDRNADRMRDAGETV